MAAATDFTIREVRSGDPEDAAQLADLWNAVNHLWPGGLTQGYPMTAERMGEQLRSQGQIFALVAEVEGTIIGFLGVAPVQGRDDVAHGTTLAVRPEWLGKGCGKALLLAVLDRVTEMGYRQYRGTTWSGNLRAIPLYKKIGDFWEPGNGTYVRLRNFIPTALKLPAAQGFFSRHGWYGSLRRELAIAPDEIRWHGIRVYPYVFEAGDDLFTMVIDRQAEAPAAVETNDFYAACYLGREEVICGLPHILTWEIVNKAGDGRPLKVELIAEGPPGIEVKVAESFEVADSLRLERPFILKPDFRPAMSGSPQLAVRSTLRLDGVPVELAMGMRAAQPLEIDVQGLETTPGKPDEEVVVRLHNRLRTAVAGEVSFEPHPGLAFDRLSAPFAVPASAWGSCRFRLTAGEGAHTTRVRAVCPPEENPALGLDAPLETRAKPVTFHSVPLDHVYAWEDEAAEQVRIEAPAFWVQVHLWGGTLSLHERLSGQQVFAQRATILGTAADDPVAKYQYRIDSADGRVRLTLEMPSDTIPGMIVERTLTVGAGAFLRLDHRLQNTTGVEQRPRLLCLGEMGLHRGVTVPLAGGVVHEIVEGLGDFPLPRERDLPKEPAAYGEGWSAREEHGLVTGIVWKSCSEIDGASVRLDLPAVAPGAFVDADPLYLVVARGDWEIVRGLWQRLWQPGGGSEEHRPTAHPVLSAGFEPGPLLVAAERVEAPFTVWNRRLKSFQGRWALHAEGFQCEPAQGELAAVDLESPASRSIVLACPDLTPRVTPGKVVLTSEATIDERDAAIVVVGDAGREVTVEPVGNGARYEVANGWMSFSVAPGHHGSMVSLQRGERELLVSSFPEPRPYQWMSAWFGGVEPFVQQPGDLQHARDSFTGEPVERRGVRGLTWRGMRLTGEVRNPRMRWLALTVEYLTTGASNLVAMVQRLTNRSGSSQEVTVGFIVFPVVTAATRVHYEVRRPGYRPAGETAERDAVPRQRIPVPPSFRFGDSSWVAMETEGSQLTLVSFSPPGEAGGWLIDRETAGLHTSAPFRLEPGETRERLAWLAVAGNPQQARAYQVLGTVWELP